MGGAEKELRNGAVQTHNGENRYKGMPDDASYFSGTLVHLPTSVRVSFLDGNWVNAMPEGRGWLSPLVTLQT